MPTVPKNISRIYSARRQSLLGRESPLARACSFREMKDGRGPVIPLAGVSVARRVSLPPLLHLGPSLKVPSYGREKMARVSGRLPERKGCSLGRSRAGWRGWKLLVKFAHLNDVTFGRGLRFSSLTNLFTLEVGYVNN